MNKRGGGRVPSFLYTAACVIVRPFSSASRQYAQMAEWLTTARAASGIYYSQDLGTLVLFSLANVRGASALRPYFAVRDVIAGVVYCPKQWAT